jgi:hypothetical protein
MTPALIVRARRERRFALLRDENSLARQVLRHGYLARFRCYQPDLVFRTLRAIGSHWGLVHLAGTRLITCEPQSPTPPRLGV